MNDRKVAIIKNKKCFISSDYVHKILNSYKGRNRINNNLRKIELSQNIEISKEQPVILYNNTKKKDINMENQIKKELSDNYGYLNNTSLKNNLIKFYSLNTSDKNIIKNETNNKINININNNLYKSLNNDKRKIIASYSNILRKRNIFKKSAVKIRTNNKLYKTHNINNIDKDKLTNEKYIKKLFGNKNNKKININDMTQRKKEYLDMNNISYKNIDIKDNEKNNKKDKRKVKIFKDGKYIKNNKEEVKNLNIMERKPKKVIKIKNDVDAFEYIDRIKNEIQNLKIVNNK